MHTFPELVKVSPDFSLLLPILAAWVNFLTRLCEYFKQWLTLEILNIISFGIYCCCILHSSRWQLQGCLKISAFHALSRVFVGWFGGGVYNQMDLVGLKELIIRPNQRYLMNRIYANWLWSIWLPIKKKKKDHDQFGQFDFILVGLELGHSETQGRINLKIKAWMVFSFLCLLIYDPPTF